MTDEKFMKIALSHAKRGLGLTAPNPSVGCVIVKDNVIISTGYTQKNGRPHAESVALEKIGEKANGATAYVTLEPCCHVGKTQPCAENLIKSGIKKVVIATSDPYHKVSGGGIEMLKNSGIEVVTGVLEESAKEINAGFFNVQEKKRPYVTVKIATSLDGKIALNNGKSKWITGDVARNYAHYLRATNDAIMVGANTYNKDNPSLDCRLAGLEDQSPTKIVVGDSAYFSDDSFFDKNAKVLHITSFSRKNDNIEQILVNRKNEELNLADALEKLAEKGITRILVEGGGKLIASLLEEKLVDELIWIRAAKIIGGDGTNSIADLGFEDMNQLSNLKLKKSRMLGEDFLEIYKI